MLKKGGTVENIHENSCYIKVFFREKNYLSKAVFENLKILFTFQTAFSR